MKLAKKTLMFSIILSSTFVGLVLFQNCSQSTFSASKRNSFGLSSSNISTPSPIISVNDNLNNSANVNNSNILNSAADTPNRQLIFSTTANGPHQTVFEPGQIVYVRVKGFSADTEIWYTYFVEVCPGNWSGCYTSIKADWAYSSTDGFWRYQIKGINIDYRFDSKTKIIFAFMNKTEKMNLTSDLYFKSSHNRPYAFMATDSLGMGGPSNSGHPMFTADSAALNYSPFFNRIRSVTELPDLSKNVKTYSELYNLYLTKMGKANTATCIEPIDQSICSSPGNWKHVPDQIIQTYSFGYAVDTIVIDYTQLFRTYFVYADGTTNETNQSLINAAKVFQDITLDLEKKKFRISRDHNLYFKNEKTGEQIKLLIRQ